MAEQEGAGRQIAVRQLQAAGANAVFQQVTQLTGDGRIVVDHIDRAAAVGTGLQNRASATPRDSIAVRHEDTVVCHQRTRDDLVAPC